MGRRRPRAGILHGPFAHRNFFGKIATIQNTSSENEYQDQDQYDCSDAYIHLNLLLCQSGLRHRFDTDEEKVKPALGRRLFAIARNRNLVRPGRSLLS